MKKFLLSIILATCLVSCTSSVDNIKYSHSNPILQATAFIPDGEPRVYNYQGEERVFLYGSRDERITGYCGYGHDVWSAPTSDLSRWRNHGEIFNVAQVKAVGYGGGLDQQHFGAPDCVYNPVTKKYYLYTFLGAVYTEDQIDLTRVKGDLVKGYDAEHGPKCVMAQSDSPAGPFIDPVICDWVPENSAGTFDPGVLVDVQEDNSVRVYAYWGMKKGDRCAELDPTDMHTVINPESRMPDRDAWHTVLADDGTMPTLFEASSIRKVDDNHYVFICSPNERKSTLYYFYSNSPLGPWHDGGGIVDNRDGWSGGNNHGSIAKINDQWYVFYHRHSAGGINRQAMMQPIDLKIDGDRVVIPQIELTSQATSYNGLNPFKRYNVSAFCYKKGKCTIVGSPREADGLQPLVNIEDGEVLAIKYFNFGEKGVSESDELELRLNAKVLKETTLTLSCAAPNTQTEPTPFATLTLSPEMSSVGDFCEISLPISKAEILKGIQEIQFSFSSVHQGELCEMKEFEIAYKGDATPNPLMDISKEKRDTDIALIPTRARAGESVKVVVYSDNSPISVVDESGKEIELRQNGDVPYAPTSYNFDMPDSPVRIIRN